MGELFRAESEGLDFAIVTIARASGSTPRTSGKLLVFLDGTTRGTIGGGNLEHIATLHAIDCIKTGRGDFIDYDLAESAGPGMICGGAVSLLTEVYSRKPKLVIIGAGHVGLALASIAPSAGFSVVIVDDRETVPPPGCAFEPVSDYYADVLALDIPAGAYYVIVTRGHENDGEALRAALQKSPSYTGMIGSRKKTDALFASLMERGVQEEALAKVFAPIGLDIGGETPGEIALSILAEVQAARYGRTCKHMRETK